MNTNSHVHVFNQFQPEHTKMIKSTILSLIGSLLLSGLTFAAPTEDRQKSADLLKKGNYKEAYEIYAKLLESTSDSSSSKDLSSALRCLRKLNQRHKTDALVEKSLLKHNSNVALHVTAANYFANSAQHFGSIIDGKFNRNSYKGERVSSFERDRVRSLQILHSIHNKIKAQKVKIDAKPAANFYLTFAKTYKGSQRSFKLQDLTDISKLPDYNKNGLYRRYGFYGNTSGAPTTANGIPIYHEIPQSLADASNDGQRWRSLLHTATKFDPTLKDQVTNIYAGFLESQFGVQTLRSYSWFGRINSISGNDDSQKGILSLHTLTDEESTARLASGVKRITFPKEHNFISIYKELFESNYHDGSKLADIYLNRRQFKKAVTILNNSLEKKERLHIRTKLNDIIHDWAKFDNITSSFPSGSNPKIGMLYRNTTSVSIDVQEIDIEAMHNADIELIKSNPITLNYNVLNRSNLSRAITHKKFTKFVGKVIATTDIKLKPKANYWDTRQDITIPVKKAGAYYITATLPDKKKIHTVLWIKDIAVVVKKVEKGNLYTVLDNNTGKPLTGATIHFFGWKQEYLKNNRKGKRRYNVLHDAKTFKTDENGQSFVKLTKNYRWNYTVTHNGKISYSTFSNNYHHYFNNYSKFNKTYAFPITDRPVYLPSQTVYGKFWHRIANYDQPDTSSFSKTQYSVTITDPMGQRVGEVINVTSDKYGGIDYKCILPEDCKLGVYRVNLKKGNLNHWAGNHTFRVEKYKKPEFEVIVESPKTPVKLGEKFTTTVKANYYHGAPVTSAKVKVKVTRHDHNALWFPIGSWDWLYGSGYGWLGVKRSFYPGWTDWGCECPPPLWWHRQAAQPELVMEQELDINPDGTVSVEIDSDLAKQIHGNKNQRYEITAEVVDASRRTIVGSGSTLAAAKPFKVTVWLNRGHLKVGEKVTANIAANTLDNKKVKSNGTLSIYSINIDAQGKVKEQLVNMLKISTTADTSTKQLLTFDQKGQFKIVAKLKDEKNREITGATFITVRGDGATKDSYAYNDLEITPDKRTYKPGDVAKLLIKTKHKQSHIKFFTRSGLKHQSLQLEGQFTIVEIPITRADMPNIFVDAFIVQNGKVHTSVCELIVPPEKRVLNVEVVSDKKKYKPRDQGTLKIKVTDTKGQPVIGSVALSVYDKAIEYISGGSNVPNIKTSFWKWRRHYYSNISHDLLCWEYCSIAKDQRAMAFLGIFGHLTGDFNSNQSASDGNKEPSAATKNEISEGLALGGGTSSLLSGPMKGKRFNASNEAMPQKEVIVRSKFADLVKWKGNIETNEQGIAEVPVDFPDNLTTWKIKTWAMSHGTKVGEGSTEVITSKDLIIRLQAPRFFVEKDEVVLSAIVHNYHDEAQQAKVTLELEGGTIKSLSPAEQSVNLKAKNGEQRIDWKTKVTGEGSAVVRMKVVTGSDSDAMQMTFPVYIHGILKQEAWSHVILPDGNSATTNFSIPEQRRPEQSRLEVRYSPTIAGSIVSALPYLAEFPHGCTEQTLNRFVPTVICQKLLLDLDVNLGDVRNHRANLNPQEIGDDQKRIAHWKRGNFNPVFDEKKVAEMVAKGIARLEQMRNNDGGWGWFSGRGERSYPHTTAVVIHGLQQAKLNGAKIPAGMIKGGVRWLSKYEENEVQKLLNFENKKEKEKEKPRKQHASNRDAFVRLVLAENDVNNQQMLDFLYRDKLKLSTYGQAVTGIALHYAKGDQNLKQRDEIIRNIEQYLIHDEENQTAYLNLRNQGYWWNWYGSEFEAHAWYLKLLSYTNPKSKQARGIVKYLVNNRKNATYWNSTRDTAYCIEAISSYLTASGEFNPNATVEVLVDGKLVKTVKIDKNNLFHYDNKMVIAGDALTTGKHKVEVRRKGDGPLYTNTYLTLFTKEDFIKKAGLEVKVERRYYKLTPDKSAKATVSGKHGQVVKQKVEKYIRTTLKPGDQVTSGDLIEVELIVESKNDYEYLLFADWKPAGCENKDVRSGYINNGLRAYMEVHDEKTAFFVHQLKRGKHNLRYQLRAEIPGKFSALPTQGEAMYAPELRSNSDEMKLNIIDRP